jgi:hypothetical protein
MTRGKAEVKVGVIHPIESYWLHFGPSEQTAIVRDNMDENFQNITKWLLFGGVDFDFISESLLPGLCNDVSAPLKVGEMAYDMILVPGCETLRSTTLERLEGFVKAGGKLVFVGDVPTLEDARQSERAGALAKEAEVVQFNKGSVLEAVEDVRMVELRNETGAMTTNLLHQLRRDGNGRWLFVAHGAESRNKHISEKQDVTIRVKGVWKATIYNTMTGEQEDAKQSLKGDVTEVYQTMYDYDSLLLWLDPVEIDNVAYNVNTRSVGVEGNSSEQNRDEDVVKGAGRERSIALPDYVDYTLSESNALLLDMAEYALDGDEWHPKEELLRLDVECRKMLGWSTDIAHVAQPWSLGEESEFHRVTLKFRIESAIEYEGAHLAIEKAEDVNLRWNGREVDNKVVGWYVDKAIKTVALPKIEKGENLLEAEVPIGKRTMIEWMYLLGDFGVEVLGKNARIIAKRDKLTFGDVTVQGLSFYTGNITYHIPIETEGGHLRIHSGFYVGAMQEASIDGKEALPMIYPPYTVSLGKVEAGKHMIDLTFYGTRQNGFGALHLADEKRPYLNPSSWRTEGDHWCYEYMLSRMGVLATPEIVEEK